MRTGYVYIMASGKNGTLYVGVTSNLTKRVYEHKHNLVEGFTGRYGVHTLVYWEDCGSVPAAIAREKQLKGWRRSYKIALIEKMNVAWRDLYEEII